MKSQGMPGAAGRTPARMCGRRMNTVQNVKCRNVKCRPSRCHCRRGPPPVLPRAGPRHGGSVRGRGAPLPKYSAAGSARVVETADGSRALEVRLSKDEAQGYQEVWLIAPDLSRLVSLGVMNSDSGTFQLPAGLEISEYPIVDVSDEPVDGNPAHSSVSIARGTLAT